MTTADSTTVQPGDLIRGIWVLVGFLMAVVGLAVTWTALNVDGWTVIAAVGVIVIRLAQKCPHGLVERGRCFYCTTPVTEAGDA